MRYWAALLVLVVIMGDLQVVPTRDGWGGEEGKTTVTGEKMTMLEKGDVVEFEGNVRLEQGKDIVTADRMRSHEKAGVVEGWGHVHLVRHGPKGDVVVSDGDTIHYEKGPRVATLTGSPRLTRRNPQSPENDLLVTAEELTLFGAEDRLRARGRAVITLERVRAGGDEAWYDDHEQRVTLTGDPKAVREDADGRGEYAGDRIILWLQEERMRLEGHVRSTIRPNPAGKK